VTFFFCDVEASTRLWEAHGEAMRSALAVHDRIVRGALQSAGGLVFATGGDGFGAAFSRAGEALTAGLAAQRCLAAEDWPEGIAIKVRMGLHTGEADERGGDYFGAEVSRAARLMAIAHGGQVLCSTATADLARGHLPAGASLADLGVHRLRDLSEPLRVFQVVGDGLPSHFPPLLSMDAFPGNLPLQVSSFIGREVELARVAKALGEARVVTLSGVGGVGKTRLALRAAAEELPRYREGAWLVELQAVRDPEAVAARWRRRSDWRIGPASAPWRRSSSSCNPNSCSSYWTTASTCSTQWPNWSMPWSEPARQWWCWPLAGRAWPSRVSGSYRYHPCRPRP
jgi:class 3 adenylate cyclase